MVELRTFNSKDLGSDRAPGRIFYTSLQRAVASQSYVSHFLIVPHPSILPVSLVLCSTSALHSVVVHYI